MNIVFILAALAPAGAWDLVEAEPVALAPASRAVLGVPGREQLLALTGDSLVLVDVSAGELDRSAVSGGHSLALQDIDDDGRSDLLVCGDAGVDRYQLDGSLVLEASLTTEPCRALATITVDEQRFLAVAGDDLWIVDPGGGDPISLGFTLDEDALLASRGDVLALGALGGDSFLEIVDDGYGELDAGGSLAWIEGRDHQWVWALSDSPGFYTAYGRERQLREAPSRFWLGEVDGDGTEDAFVLYPDIGQVGVFTSVEGRERVLWLPTSPGPVAIADLDGDGCQDVVLTDATEGTATIHWTEDCGAVVDVDGDGWTVLQGDCDDGDPDVHPEAEEVCNGVDDDCDGAIDEDGLEIELTVELDGEDRSWDEASLSGWCTEGGSARLVVSIDPACMDGAVELDLWDAFPVEVATCVASDEGLECDLFDDGEGTFGVQALGDTGGLLAGETCSLRIDNVAPRLSNSGGCSGNSVDVDSGYAEIELQEGSSVSHQLEAWDPGDDWVSFETSGGPDGLNVSSSGYISYSATEPGTWYMDLTLRDEDGGVRSYDVTLHVVEYEPLFDFDLDFSGCMDGWCCGSSSGILLPPLLALWFRRRRLIVV